jgi:hypothetical protein
MSSCCDMIERLISMCSRRDVMSFFMFLVLLFMDMSYIFIKTYSS